jgi:effector-binding domain-containing protein
MVVKQILYQAIRHQNFKEQHMTYPCELVDQDPQPTLFIRTTTTIKELPQALGKAYGAIGEFMAQQDLQPAGATYAAYYEFEKDNVDVEIGFPVPSQLPGKGEIQPGELPAGKIARCLYQGPYNKIEPAYTALADFVEEQGFEATGVAYEFYLNDPNQVAPSELLTQVVFPLK